MNTTGTRMLAIVALALSAAACSVFDAHVYDPSEFNRLSPTFNTEPADRSEVTICYLAGVTPLATAEAMAEELCARHGKHAHYRETDVTICPVATPAGARFDCVADEL